LKKSFSDEQRVSWYVPDAHDSMIVEVLMSKTLVVY